MFSFGLGYYSQIMDDNDDDDCYYYVKRENIQGEIGDPIKKMILLSMLGNRLNLHFPRVLLLLRFQAMYSYALEFYHNFRVKQELCNSKKT